MQSVIFASLTVHTINTSDLNKRVFPFIGCGMNELAERYMNYSSSLLCKQRKNEWIVYYCFILIYSYFIMSSIVEQKRIKSQKKFILPSS